MHACTHARLRARRHARRVRRCAALCCADPACVAFSLNAGASGARWCYLKASVSATSPGPSEGCDSGCVRATGECGPTPGAIFPWFNLTLPRAARLAALVEAMTINESISWLNDGVPAIPRLGLPAYSWESEALHGVSWAGKATVFPENIAWGATFDVPLIARVADVIATEVRAKFVMGLGNDGSSREFYGLSFMTPNNNLFIDPRWGRGQETYGEDPVLTSAITYALVRGVQEGPDLRYRRMIATSKHWLAYHLESWAGDGQYRLSHSFNVSETDIQQTYLPSFAAAVRANVSAVMCDYSGTNGTNAAWPKPDGKEPWGVPSCLHPDMERLLRGQLGYEGYVISDAGAITFAGPGYHGYTSTLLDAACLAMNAGTDLALGGEYAGTLHACVQNGNVTVPTIKRALTRVLRSQFDLGWFDTVASVQQSLADPVSYNSVSPDVVASEEHLALAQQVATSSLVLLKNAGGVLPLVAKALSRVALIGPAATDTGTSAGSYIGNYAGCEDGPGGDRTKVLGCHVVSLLEALSAAANASSGAWELAFSPGTDINTPNATEGFGAALTAAKGAGVIVAAVGLDTCQESRCSEGEANDRAVDGGQFPASGLDLGGSQLALLQALRASYPTTPLVVLLFNGGPISSPWVFEHADAILECWYPGVRGGSAIVDVLLGHVSPSGRMPVTTVASVDDLPLYTDWSLATSPGRTHRYFTRTPLAPFGWGLSYVDFRYEGLSVSPPALVPACASVTVAARVTHSGGVALEADEVVMLFASFQAESTGLASIPRQQLLAFERLYSLTPGESRNVSFVVPRDALALVDAGGAMRVQSGEWKLWLGGGPPSTLGVLHGSLIVQ
jgi:beta-glucosidase